MSTSADSSRSNADSSMNSIRPAQGRSGTEVGLLEGPASVSHRSYLYCRSAVDGTDREEKDPDATAQAAAKRHRCSSAGPSSTSPAIATSGLSQSRFLQRSTPELHDPSPTSPSAFRAAVPSAADRSPLLKSSMMSPSVVPATDSAHTTEGATTSSSCEHSSGPTATPLSLGLIRRQSRSVDYLNCQGKTMSPAKRRFRDPIRDGRCPPSPRESPNTSSFVDVDARATASEQSQHQHQQKETTSSPASSASAPGHSSLDSSFDGSAAFNGGEVNVPMQPCLLGTASAPDTGQTGGQCCSQPSAQQAATEFNCGKNIHGRQSLHDRHVAVPANFEQTFVDSQASIGQVVAMLKPFVKRFYSTGDSVQNAVHHLESNDVDSAVSTLEFAYRMMAIQLSRLRTVLAHCQSTLPTTSPSDPALWASTNSSLIQRALRTPIHVGPGIGSTNTVATHLSTPATTVPYQSHHHQRHLERLPSLRTSPDSASRHGNPSQLTSLEVAALTLTKQQQTHQQLDSDQRVVNEAAASASSRSPASSGDGENKECCPVTQAHNASATANDFEFVLRNMGVSSEDLVYQAYRSLAVPTMPTTTAPVTAVATVGAQSDRQDPSPRAGGAPGQRSGSSGPYAMQTRVDAGTSPGAPAAGGTLTSFPKRARHSMATDSDYATSELAEAAGRSHDYAHATALSIPAKIQHERSCSNCHCNITPQWRFIESIRYCNACYMRHKRLMSQQRSSQRHIMGNAAIIGSSDDTTNHQTTPVDSQLSPSSPGAGHRLTLPSAVVIPPVCTIRGEAASVDPQLAAIRRLHAHAQAALMEPHSSGMSKVSAVAVTGFPQNRHQQRSLPPKAIPVQHLGNR